MCNLDVLLIVLAVTSVNCIVIRPSNSSKPVPSPPPSEQDDDPLKLLTDQCLECICRSVSSCSQNVHVRCRKEGAVFCGPFFISRVYWNEAGQPGYVEGTGNATLDFIQCANERFCSDETVRGYMRRYATDCDGDGVVTCMDFALIHKNGPSGCKNPANRSGTYYSNFVECFEQVKKSSIQDRRYHRLTPK